MRQAIITKYLGPTNTRGSRIKARAAAGSITSHYHSELSSEANHTNAAIYFANEKGWLDKNTLVGGAMPDGTGYCFVLIEKVQS
jgi:hypothetical protein